MGQRAAGKKNGRGYSESPTRARSPLADALYGRVLFNPTNVPPFLWHMIRMRVA